MKTLEVANINIEVVSKNIKNIHLAVYPPHGRVRLATPMGVDDETIRLFAVSKLGWIRKQQRKFVEQDRQTSRKYVDRESHYFDGKRYLLRLIEGEGRPRVEVTTKTYIDLHVNSNSTVKERETLINAWYRAQLKKKIPAILDKWQNKMGIEVNSWMVKQMKTKWGTCNIEGKRILLNLELAKKPERCLEYIILHELAHLFERKHNDRFLAIMNKFMPQWKMYREELNRLPISHLGWEY